MSRLVRLRLTVFGVVLLGMAVLPLGGRVASSPAAAAQKAAGLGKLTANLTATRLAPVQASEARLSFRFLRPSTRFSYLLERRQGGRWIPLRSVKRKGHFKGAHVSTVKQLFGRKAVRVGSYRLRLHSDRSSVSLRFSIFAAEPVTGATSVSAGGKLTCILVAGGGVECWGYNGDGELGNGTMTNSSAPVAVQGISGATSVNTGYKHACALSGASTFSCWGSNELGELGIGTLTNSSTPVAVNELNGVVANSSGAAHTCAVLTDGALYCWGDNEFGELGIGTLNRLAPYGISSPEQVNTVSNAIGVSAGFLHTCALISGGSIECWGYNQDGQVGNGTVNRVRPHAEPSPVHVVGITKAISISAGDFHTCALIAGGTVKCWGADQFGQLGDGRLQDSAKPVTVVGIKNAVSISSGVLHSCALIAGGAVKCWGGNDEGELGTGTLTASSVPLSVVRPTRHNSR